MKKKSKKLMLWLDKRSVKININKKIRRIRNRKKALGQQKIKKNKTFKINNFIMQMQANYECIKVIGERFKIILPDKFDLADNYERTINIINVIRKTINFQYNNDTIVLSGIDFEHMNYISTSASLLLIAEFDAWNKKGVKLRALVKTWHNDVLEHFSQIGFFDLINCHVDKNIIPRKSVIKFLSGNTIKQKNTGQIIKNIRNKIEDLVGKGIHKQRLYESLNESILNVGYHAYSNANNYKRWWLTASFSTTEKKLRVAFCDRGITIPESMKHTEKGNIILRLIGKSSTHSQRIKAAMKGVSSTELANRGKGLPFLNNFIKESKNGKLHIMSGKGYYLFDHQKNIEQSKERNTCYQGTLITWEISVE